MAISRVQQTTPNERDVFAAARQLNVRFKIHFDHLTDIVLLRQCGPTVDQFRCDDFDTCCWRVSGILIFGLFLLVDILGGDPFALQQAHGTTTI